MRFINLDIGLAGGFFCIFFTGVSSPAMVSDIPYAVMKKMCCLLNVKSAVGDDYRALAGELGMKTSDVRLLSQKDDPTDEVMKWWEPQKSATVKEFREILMRMQRHDVLAIIDEGKQEGKKIYKIKSRTNNMKGHLIADTPR